MPGVGVGIGTVPVGVGVGIGIFTIASGAGVGIVTGLGVGVTVAAGLGIVIGVCPHVCAVIKKTAARKPAVRIRCLLSDVQRIMRLIIFYPYKMWSRQDHGKVRNSVYPTHG